MYLYKKEYHTQSQNHLSIKCNYVLNHLLWFSILSCNTFLNGQKNVFPDFLVINLKYCRLQFYLNIIFDFPRQRPMHQIHVVVMLPQKQFCLDTRFKTWDKHLSKYVYKKRSINPAPE